VNAPSNRIHLRKQGQLFVFEDRAAGLHESDRDRGLRAVLRAGHLREEAFLDYVRSLGRKGAYVDASGFIGVHAVYFARLCDPDHVYTFEPRRMAREELERNLVANQLEHKVSVLAMGLAAKREEVTVEIEGSPVAFACAPLDEVVDRPVSVIRIDLPGMGAEILRGATRILDQFHPVVFAEARTLPERQAIAECLSRHGYARTGRVFNSPPTYEFAFLSEADALEELRRAYAEIARLHDDPSARPAPLRGSLDASPEPGSGARSRAPVAGAEAALARRLRASEAEVQRLRSELLASTRVAHHLQAQRSRLERDLRVAALQKDSAKNTLSFQLGHLLIHATKSRRGLLSLPRSLLELRREAARRRGQGKPTNGLDVQTTLYRKRHPDPRRLPTLGFELPASLCGEGPLPERLGRLRVACIMDEFTAKSFGPECQLLHLRPTGWDADLSQFKPDLLFVESAWRGRDEAWVRKIGQGATELHQILGWCRDQRVPTVFWNKEDPVHFASFRNTADLFDFVFTTDVDCVHRYKDLLQHDRVYLLPFACQPRIQNPIEKYERKESLCFAGAYYARYPERQRDFLAMLHELCIHWPIEIFDRNHGDTHPDFQFPEAYRHLIRGKLPFDQIDRAYKGFQYAINLNSIKYSQSMFARRVYELLASNTVTVSNFSRGMRLLFGDLVITSDDPRQHVARLRDISATPARLRKFKLAGLRKVLSEHTYQDRLAYVVSKVFDLGPAQLLPEVTVVGIAQSRDDADELRRAFDRQAYPHKRLLLIAPAQVCEDPAVALPAGSVILPLERTGNDRLANHLEPSRHVATFVPQDYYGPAYLTDLALATRYWRGRAIGKAAHYAWTGSAPVLVHDGQQYRATTCLSARAALLRDTLLGDITVGDYAGVAARFEVTGSELLAIDEMSYCRDAGPHSGDRGRIAAVDDLPDLDQGVSLPRLLAAAEEIKAPDDDGEDSSQALTAEALAGLFPAREGDVRVSHDADGMVIESLLAEGAHRYLSGARDFPLSALGFSSTGRLFVDVTPGLGLDIVLLFLDAAGQRVGQKILSVQTNHEIDVPPETRSVRLSLRAAGPGRAIVRAIVLDNVASAEPARLFGRHPALLLTNTYPSADDLYRHAFVHRRVLEYARRRAPVHVFCLRPAERLSYYEFEGVDVARGGKPALRSMLATRQHDTILVHFLDEAMWDLLRPHLDAMKVIVWLHGSEVQPWHRRAYDHASPADLTAAKVASEARVRFWQSVLGRPHPNLKLVFVSRYFADEVQEDLGIELPPSSYEIIHNLIDTDLFSFQPKDAEQRKRVLTVRPFATRKYANDLSVRAILELSEKPFFTDLEFRIVGDGRLFDETVAPLRGFDNVIIDQRFLTQTEIAALHKDYGVFLSPTRMDSQGVSRDEAMASGLVPVTSAVAAVPEFVDDACGFLAPFDDASALAAAIETLYHDPERFERMSVAAAARVRRQSGPDATAGRELDLFRSRGDDRSR
jgi:FkbM family methyltransferase